MGCFVVHDWMVKELELSGNELLIYAIIYNVSQDGASKFAASQAYLADMLGITDRTARNILASMVEKGLLVKYESNGGTNEYMASEGGRKNFPRGVGKNFLGVGKNFRSSDVAVYNNLLENNINNNNLENTSSANILPVVVEEKKELDKENIEREKENKIKEKEKEHKENEQETKEQFHPNQKLEYAKGIRLTVKEFDKLVEAYGEQDTRGIIDWFSLYKADKGYKNKSDYMAVKRWVAEAYYQRKRPSANGLFDEYRKAFDELRGRYGEDGSI